MPQLKYNRILLKLSGEALAGNNGYGIDPDVLGQQADSIAELSHTGVQIGLVIGGGNIFRGAKLAKVGINHVTGDHMGMLATVINALSMQDALENRNLKTRVMSAIQISQICEDYSRRRAIRDLEQGRVTLFAAGTGNPFFTTDSAASLRAIEIGAKLLIKATNVDGVYSTNPHQDSSAKFYPSLSYDQALQENLEVMDATALVLCRDHKLPIRILNIRNSGALMRLVYGADIGSLIQ